MAVKAGSIIHAFNTFVVDRIQTAGPGNLNIPTERIYELGNWESVAVVRDVPDLSFNLECLDVDTEVEGILTGSANPASDPFGSTGLSGTEYALATTVPIDVVTPFKSAQNQFNIIKGVAIPQLTVESASYRYGLRDNAGETFTLRGDSIFYVPGQPYNESFTGTGAQTTFNFANTALPYNEQGVTRYALNVSVNGIRQRHGDHYTDSATGVTFTTAPASGAAVRVVYGSATVGSYPATVHEGLAVKPAAIKGKDIKVYVGTDGGSPAAPFLWGDVQSVTVDYRVNLEADFEFGNPYALSRDYAGSPDVTGAIEIKPLDVNALFDKIQQVTGVPATEVVGPQSSVSLPFELRLLNPDSGGTSAHTPGTILKTLYVPDARFTIPGYDGRANQKLVTTLNFESDGGTLLVYKGRRF